MLSDRLKEQIKIFEVCANDHTDFKKGTVFENLTVIDSRIGVTIHDRPVVFLGFISSDEMLVCSTNGRQYLSLRDGWGVKEKRLYALSVGWAQSFTRPVSANETETPCGSRGPFAAMAEKFKRERLQVIREVLKKDDK